MKANVQDQQRRFEYSSVRWLNKSELVDALARNQPIFPCLVDESDRMCFVGVGSSANLIGTVTQENGSDWQLIALDPISRQLESFGEQFRVLSLDSAESFYWRETSDKSTPLHALRLAIDEVNSEYLFCGKRLDSANKMAQHLIDLALKNKFGRVNSHDRRLLLAVHNNDDEMLGLEHYDILCLRPSPVHLKQLCRDQLRSWLNRNQLDLVDYLNRCQVKDQQIIEYILYPNRLSAGQSMLRDLDKLVREDNQFEMLIKSNGDLVCQTINDNAGDDDLKLERIIYRNVDSIFMDDKRLVFNLLNGKAQIVERFNTNSSNSSDESSGKKFGIEKNTDKPSYSIYD